jgi:hypothetical protein
MADSGTYDTSMNPPAVPADFVAGALPPEDTSKWPKVIGVFSLIYAILGMTCGIAYAGMTMMTEQLMAMGGMTDVTLPMPIKLTVVALVLCGLILGIVLLSAAVQLLRRKRSGVKLHLRWAMLRMILILLAATTTLFTGKASVDFEKARLDAQNRLMEERGGQAMKIPSDEALHRRTILTTAGFSAAQAIYPLFIGFYLSRRRIREQIAHWSNK